MLIHSLCLCIDDGEDWNPWGEEFEREKKSFALAQKASVKWWTNQTLDFGKQFYKSKLDGTNQPYQLHNVEIWGKAAIGNHNSVFVHAYICLNIRNIQSFKCKFS